MPATSEAVARARWRRVPDPSAANSGRWSRGTGAASPTTALMAASSRSPFDRKLAYTVSTETPAARATSRIPVAAQPRSPNSRAAAEATIARVSAACCSRRGDR